MAKPSLLILNLINTTKEQFFYHDIRVKQLQEKEFPFPACNKMLDLLSIIDDEILRELDNLEKEQIEGEIKTGKIKQDIDKVKAYGNLVEILHYILTFFEIGNREYVPEGSVVLINNIVKKFDVNVEFILVPIYKYNYIYLDLMKPIKKSLRLPTFDKIFEGFPAKYPVFGFPLIQKENTILNSMLAHEVGHYIDEVKNMSDRLMDKVSLDLKAVGKLAKKVKSVEISLTYFITPEELTTRITKLAASQIREWLKELVADAIAFQLIGPIYFFSLVNFLITLSEIDETSGSHPPPRMRIKILMDEFERLNYTNIIKETKNEEHSKLSDDLISIIQDIKYMQETVEQPKAEDAIDTLFSELVMDAVKKVIPELQKEVNKNIGSNRYEPKEFQEDVFKLLRFLDFVVPPVETKSGTPASAPTILNVGSIYELVLMDNLNKVFKAEDWKDRLEVRHTLHKLILKALELSDIESRMKKLLEGLDSDE